MTDDNQAILLIPDIHHKIKLVDRIRAHHPGVSAIFLGDYFDDFYDAPADREATCRWLKNALTAGVRHPAFLAGVERGGTAPVAGILWCDWNGFDQLSLASSG